LTERFTFEVTLRKVNKLHEEGYFERFGICDYMSWEVANICEICEKKEWIIPTVYRGLYNAFHRAVEPDLLPCLRQCVLSLYCLDPIAGDFLTDRYHRDTSGFEHGTRFDPNQMQGRLHHSRYWKGFYLDIYSQKRSVL
jgi:aflatoxin B1 aldehyde reductase